ncbi:unnamed protein product, partial [Amoebophrya sp. A25]|eukprot:GSA25T00010028001.1
MTKVYLLHIERFCCTTCKMRPSTSNGRSSSRRWRSSCSSKRKKKISSIHLLSGVLTYFFALAALDFELLVQASRGPSSEDKRRGPSRPTGAVLTARATGAASSPTPGPASSSKNLPGRPSRPASREKRKLQ